MVNMSQDYGSQMQNVFVEFDSYPRAYGDS